MERNRTSLGLEFLAINYVRLVVGGHPLATTYEMSWPRILAHMPLPFAFVVQYVGFIPKAENLEFTI